MTLYKYSPEELEQIEALALKNNVSIQAIKKRLRLNNYDFSKVDYKNSKARLVYFLNGRPAIDIARSNGITKSQFYLRLFYGWPLEKACTYKEPSSKEISLKTGLSINKVNFLLKTHTRQELMNGKI